LLFRAAPTTCGTTAPYSKGAAGAALLTLIDML
jgi:hypothetical protein